MTAKRPGLQWSDGAAGSVLAAVARVRDWRDDALCPEIGGELFFPGKGGRATQSQQACGLCPVTTQCLAFALDHACEEGTWGGVSAAARRPMHAARAKELLAVGKRCCSMCGVVKPLGEFAAHGGAVYETSAWRADCRDCESLFPATRNGEAA